MRASWEKTDLGNGAAVCTAQASMWGTTQSVSYVVYPTTMFSTRVAVCDTPAKTSMIAKDKKALFAINGSYSISGNPSTFTMVDKVVKVASTIESASKVNGVIAIDAEGSVDVKSCTFSDYTDVEDEYEEDDEEGTITIYGNPKSYAAIQKHLEECGFEDVGGDFTYIPNDLKEVTPEQRETLDKMIERLEEFDDVQTVYTNMQPEEGEEE